MSSAFIKSGLLWPCSSLQLPFNRSQRTAAHSGVNVHVRLCFSFHRAQNVFLVSLERRTALSSVGFFGESVWESCFHLIGTILVASCSSLSALSKWIETCSHAHKLKHVYLSFILHRVLYVFLVSFQLFMARLQLGHDPLVSHDP